MQVKNPATIRKYLVHSLMLNYIFAIAFCAWSVPAAAQLYRCENAKTGAKTYSSAPCPAGFKSAVIPRVAPPHPPPARQPSQRMVVSAPPAPAGGGASYSASEQAGISSSWECEQARRAQAVRDSRVTNFASDARERPIDVAGACGLRR